MIPLSMEDSKGFHTVSLNEIEKIKIDEGAGQRQPANERAVAYAIYGR